MIYYSNFKGLLEIIDSPQIANTLNEINRIFFPNGNLNFKNAFISIPEEWTLDEVMILLSQNLILSIEPGNQPDDFDGTTFFIFTLC